MARNTNDKKGFAKPIRNRGEDINEPARNMSYDYMPQDQYQDRSQERSIKRHEVRSVYDAMYQLEQRRDQRAFNRVTDASNEFYAGIDPRRRQEIGDGGMVREDHAKMANLSQQAIHCEYPKAGYYATPYIDSMLRGVDPENDDNGRGRY